MSQNKESSEWIQIANLSLRFIYFLSTESQDRLEPSIATHALSHLESEGLQILCKKRFSLFGGGRPDDAITSSQLRFPHWRPSPSWCHFKNPGHSPVVLKMLNETKPSHHRSHQRMHVATKQRKDGYLSLQHHFLNTNSPKGRRKSARGLGGFRMKEILPQDEATHPIEST